MSPCLLSKMRPIRVPAIPVILLTFLLLGGPFPARLALGGTADPERDLPHLDKLEIFQPGEPSILYTDRGEPFAFLSPEYRIFVPLARVPKQVRQAVLDAEDARFYEHGAISLKGMARAALRNLTAAKLKEGGSTITQQLAKSLFLTPERTLSRKLKEIQIAQEIERRYSKDKILEMYLNAIYFGGGAYGIEAAARIYFGKSVQHLTLPEAALLAGLPKAPSASSPFNDLKRAKERRDYVLSRMEKEGHISAAQAKEAMRHPVDLKPFFQGQGISSAFADFIRKELEPRYGQVMLAKGGLRIHTTLNLKMQRTATDVLRRGLAEIERGQAGQRRKAAAESALEGALVALDPVTGEIRAMVGGRDHERTEWNRAVQAKRQPGSAFKPFVYAAALEGGFTPASLLDDYPVSYSIRQGGRFVDWSPENYDRQFRGEVTLRRALEESINVPTVRLLEAVGVDPVISLARRMGIRSDLRPEYALALGVSEVSLLELVSAYGVFANRGIRFLPRGIRWVAAPNGDILEVFGAPGQRVLSDEVSFIMTSLLQGAVERGTARRAKVSGPPIAAKTGTSQDAVDIWLVGYWSRLVAGLWIGFDQPRSLGSHETAGRLGAPVWADFMRRVLPVIPDDPVPIPENVFAAQVNWRTGLPAGPEDPEAITEFFVRGEVAIPEETAEVSEPMRGPEPEPVVAPPPPPARIQPLPPLVTTPAPEPEGARQR